MTIRKKSIVNKNRIKKTSKNKRNKRNKRNKINLNNKKSRKKKRKSSKKILKGGSNISSEDRKFQDTFKESLDTIYKSNGLSINLNLATDTPKPENVKMTREESYYFSKVEMTEEEWNNYSFGYNFLASYSYTEYVKDIKLVPIINSFNSISNPENPENPEIDSIIKAVMPTIEIFSKNIFNAISSKPYPLITNTDTSKDISTLIASLKFNDEKFFKTDKLVPFVNIHKYYLTRNNGPRFNPFMKNRQNHGQLNHMRTLFFGIYLWKEFKIAIAQKFIKEYAELKKLNLCKCFFIIMVTPLFYNILRINEGKYPNEFKLRTSKWFLLEIRRIILDFSNYGKAFSNITSTLFYLSIMKTICGEEYHELIELCAFGLDFSSIGEETGKIDLKKMNSIIEKNNEAPENTLKIKLIKFLYYYISLPHHIDHCRGPWSNNVLSGISFELFNNYIKEYGNPRGIITNSLSINLNYGDDSIKNFFVVLYLKFYELFNETRYLTDLSTNVPKGKNVSELINKQLEENLNTFLGEGTVLGTDLKLGKSMCSIYPSFNPKEKRNISFKHKPDKFTFEDLWGKYKFDENFGGDNSFIDMV